MMNESSLTAALQGLPIPHIRYFDSIPSTNDVALQWAEAGCEDGCLVAADTQTAGRGRLNRRWVTEPGSALAFTLVFKPSQPDISQLGLYSPLGALGLCDALEKTYGLKVQIKWPNDVLLNGLKAAGILVEAIWLGEKLQGVVVGIGVNVAPSSVPPADELLFPATCVQSALQPDRPVDRLELLKETLTHIFERRAQFGREEFFQAWEDHLAYRGEWVEIQPLRGPVISGKVLGVATDGNLRLLTAKQEEISIAAGDVRLRPV